MRYRWVSTVLASAFLLASAGLFAAEPRRGHSEYLASLTATALANGFPARSVPLLEVAPGPRREVVARALLDRLGRGELGRRLRLAGLKSAPRDDKRLSYLGDAGYVEVMADGTKLRARGAIDDPKEIERAGSRRLEKSELERLGERFIREQLSALVRIDAGEKLTFLGVRYLYDEVGNADPSGPSSHRESVVAGIALFGREVAGIPVVGSGSKVAVWFDNSREAVGFDVDWPTYRRSARIQDILSQRDLARRVAATTVPLEDTPNATVRRFECGYVDLGATRRGKLVQAGCSIAFEGRGRGEEPWARVEFVPAGTRVIREASWPLSAALAAGDLVNTRDARFQRYLNVPKPPAPPRPPRTR